MPTTEAELCPKCKKGHLQPVGKASTISEDEPFTPTVHGVYGSSRAYHVLHLKHKKILKFT